jgi:hypothetical protein
MAGFLPLCGELLFFFFFFFFLVVVVRFKKSRKKIQNPPPHPKKKKYTHALGCAAICDCIRIHSCSGAATANTNTNTNATTRGARGGRSKAKHNLEVPNDPSERERAVHALA